MGAIMPCEFRPERIENEILMAVSHCEFKMNLKHALVGKAKVSVICKNEVVKYGDF
ncbi:MAG: hypothetical protein ACJAVN_001156 [Roseivirga sp.]|jgi:hypothetical protein